MKKLKSNHASSPKRKAVILRAALACFMEKGYDGTGIGDICARAEVSVGSLYHHFKSKEQLAAALYLEGIRDYQRGLTADLSERTSARAGVRAIVRYHLTWVRENSDWARFLFHQRHSEFMGDTDEEFIRLNNEFISKLAIWFRTHIESGELRRMPPDLYACVILGPCQEYARIYLSGHYLTALEDAVRGIGDAAWQALRAGDPSGGSPGAGKAGKSGKKSHLKGGTA